MRRLMLALTVAVSAALGAISPAAAQDYPFCLQGKDYGLPGLCYFRTYQQCLASASGTFSYCGINPRFAFVYTQPGRWPPPR
ncbi:DUF3551 domain-containing protein [Bradyrhizobium sp. BRP22]|uniref:DUF3551 domain-containing protein n=1 Tax=Bradyrhizobium sp. BRP22 TaxID=2793821 RepID=UPI001CD310A7|nr:DUF3551 domain-containing protein [Bradyrhizobium sp. BRP22]MCA1452200.1 DUF3551 domain-containing protein [Bradyrhizobium sp. BRP22]